MKKYHLVPYTENIPEILKEDDEPDDIKLKKIIQTLHKMLRPYTSNESSAHIDEVKATPISTEERTTQTSERGDEPSVIVNYLSNTYRQKGRSLLVLLRPVLTCDPQTLEISIDEKPLQGSNIVDLVSYLVSRSKKLPVPAHFDRVTRLLVKENLPVTIVNHDRFKRRTLKARATIRRGASSF